MLRLVEHAKEPCLHDLSWFKSCKPMCSASLRSVDFRLSFVKMLACKKICIYELKISPSKFKPLDVFNSGYSSIL